MGLVNEEDSIQVKFGEKIVINYGVSLDDEDIQSGPTVRVAAYSTRLNKWMDDAGQFTIDATGEEASSDIYDLDIGTGELIVIPYPMYYNQVLRAVVDTSSLSTEDLIQVVITVLDGDETVVEEVEAWAQVGYIPASSSGASVEVYGFLKDAYGEPVKNIAVTFTVLNTTGYFDNSPTTSMTATALTDSQGKFSIPLNRNYDYVLSVSQVNYLKRVSLSELPNTVTTVEVTFGKGIGC